MKDATLIAVSFKSSINHEALRLVVHTVGQEYSVVLFENSVFQEAMKARGLFVACFVSLHCATAVFRGCFFKCYSIPLI